MSSIKVHHCFYYFAIWVCGGYYYYNHVSRSFTTFSEIHEKLSFSFQAPCLGQCDLPLSLHLWNRKTQESSRSSCLIQDTEFNLGSLGWGLRGCIFPRLQGLLTCRSVGHTLGKKDLYSLDNCRQENKMQTVTSFDFFLYIIPTGQETRPFRTNIFIVTSPFAFTSKH